MKQVPGVTIVEIYVFLLIVVQMGHHQSDKLKDYCSTGTIFYNLLWTYNRFFDAHTFLNLVTTKMNLSGQMNITTIIENENI
jgi:hypothetical protein